MSIPYSGTPSRSAGLMSAITRELKKVSLKPVKKVVVQFDPFHEKVKETRKFLVFLTSPKVLETNPYCLLKTNIVCDRSEPTVTFNLNSGENVILKCSNLDSLNILELYNKHITSLVPVEKPEEDPLLQLKRKRKWPRRIKPGSKHRGVVLLTGRK